MSGEFIGGLTVKRGDGATPEVFTAVENLMSLDGLGVSVPTVDVTNYDDAVRRFIAGLGEGSELSVECNRTHAASSTQDDLVGDVGGAALNMQIALTDGTTAKTYSFSALVTGYSLGLSFEDKQTITFTAKINGAVTVA